MFHAIVLTNVTLSYVSQMHNKPVVIKGNNSSPEEPNTCAKYIRIIRPQMSLYRCKNMKMQDQKREAGYNLLVFAETEI